VIYPFVSKPAPLESVQQSYAVRLYKALESTSGNVRKLDSEHKEYLKAIFNELHHPETYRQGLHKVSGYIIDFTPWLKTYWVKSKRGGISEIKSFNKTVIRENACFPSQIAKIVEISEK